MGHMTDEETLKVLEATLSNCENMIVKFEHGTSQHSLLINRIKALVISRYVILKDPKINDYSIHELQDALIPIESILHKTTKAIEKHDTNSSTYKRLLPMIMAVTIMKQALNDYLASKEE